MFGHPAHYAKPLWSFGNRAHLMLIVDPTFVSFPLSFRSSAGGFESATIYCLGIFCAEFQLTLINKGFSEKDFDDECQCPE